MGTKTTLFGASVALCIAIFYQLVLKDLLYLTLGVGRSHQKIEEFPYKCRRIYSPFLESCEDMVLDTEGRRLYATCSSLESRRFWSPGGEKYDVSGRDLKDHVSVLNIDEPGPDGLYGLHQLKIAGNYKSSSNGKDIDLISLDVEVLPDSRLRFYLINLRPPIDEAGKPLVASKVGANSTIEIFEHTRGSQDLEYIKTVSSDLVFAPNNLVADGNGGFFVTNDRDVKVPKIPILNFIIGYGSVAHCFPNSTCEIVAKDTFKMANGIARIKNKLFVANSAKAFISVLTIHANGTLTLDTKIKLPMPLDNLSLDSKGDIYVAGFPNSLGFMQSFENPDLEVGATAFKIVRKVGKNGEVEYMVEKVVEDVEGRVLPPTTTVVHDSVTGNLWMTGITAKYVSVCEKIDEEGGRYVKRGDEGDCKECAEKAKAAAGN